MHAGKCRHTQRAPTYLPLAHLVAKPVFNQSPCFASQALKDGKRLLKDGGAGPAMVRFEKALMLAKVSGRERGRTHWVVDARCNRGHCCRGGWMVGPGRARASWRSVQGGQQQQLLACLAAGNLCQHTSVCHVRTPSPTRSVLNPSASTPAGHRRQGEGAAGHSRSGGLRPHAGPAAPGACVWERVHMCQRAGRHPTMACRAPAHTKGTPCGSVHVCVCARLAKAGIAL